MKLQLHRRKVDKFYSFIINRFPDCDLTGKGLWELCYKSLIQNQRIDFARLLVDWTKLPLAEVQKRFTPIVRNPSPASPSPDKSETVPETADAK